MKKKLLFSTSLILLLCVVEAQADWQAIYSNDFSSDPGWITNNPANYYWDQNDQSFFSRQIDGTDEYAYKPLPSLQTASKWKVEYDIKPISYGFGANGGLSLVDSDMDTSSYESTYVKLDFNSSNDKIQLLWWNSSDNHSYVHILPELNSFTRGIWYNAYFEWDSDTGILSAGVKERDSEELFREVSVSGIGPFNTIDRIAMSIVGDDYVPGATGETYFDNITVSVPEPASLSLLLLGGAALLRKRRG